MEPPSDMDGDFADDFVLEVSNLRTGRLLDTRRASYEEAVFAPLEASDDDLSVTALDSDGSAAQLVLHHPPRLLASPQARSIVLIGLALLLCAVILFNLPGMNQGLVEVFQPTTPTPVVSFAPGDNLVYFVQTVPWGVLTVDRKTVALAGDGVPIVLTAGKHSIVYNAAPFPILRCTITVPEDRHHDTCPLTSNVSFDGPSSDARVININTSPDSLPAAAHTSLVRAVSATFAANPLLSGVATGDHYLGANSAAVASAPLIASLSLQLNIDPARPFPVGVAGPSCVSLCAQLGEYDSAYWTLVAHTFMQWHFSTLDGDDLPSSDVLTDLAIQLAVQWNGNAWSLAPLTYAYANYGEFCNDVFFGSAGGTSPITLQNGDHAVSVQAPSEPNGCAIVISKSNDVNEFTVGLPSDAALYIYRFGVILAGNDLAHKQQSQLPRATGHERDLALQWFNFTS